MIARCVVLGLALATTAAADPKQDARALHGEGQQRYAAGDYQAAAAKFLAAHELDPDPAYLYNIAQAYRFAKLCHQSVTYYRKFLAAIPDPPNKQDVGKFLVEVTECAKGQPEPVPDPVPKPDPRPDPKPDPRPVIPDAPGSLRRKLGITGIAVGAAGVGLGIVFGVRIEQLQRGTDELCGTSCPIGIKDMIVEREDSAATARLGMYASFIGGGALVLAGTLLYVSGRANKRSTVGIVPASGGAFVTWSLTH